MESQNSCVYCGCFANSRDHFIPFSYNHSGKRFDNFKQDKENIYPACSECNSIAGNKIFDTIEEKRLYIQLRLQKKYSKILKNYAVWEKEELEELSYKLRKGIKLKSEARKWITNRIYFPQVIYKEEDIQEQLKKIIKIISQDLC